MKIGLTVIDPSDQMVSTLVIVAKQGEAFFSLLLSPRFFKRLDQKGKNKNASLRLSFKEPLMWPIYCLSQVKLMTNAYSFKSVTCRKSWLAWLGSGGRVGKGYWWSWNQMPEIFNILCLRFPWASSNLLSRCKVLKEHGRSPPGRHSWNFITRSSRSLRRNAWRINLVSMSVIFLFSAFP